MVLRVKCKVICFFLVFLMILSMTGIAAKAEENADAYQSEAYVLMEASTGTVIDAKNPDKQLRPASITKIMTLLLIFEAIDSGKLHYDDSVSVSEHAASMGGSQVFLEPNETQSVNDMIKCISIASANDASVAMAEHIAGSEEQFVQMMNEKAAQLGMKNTHFVNCYGLDTDGHYTTAMDVALMSRELIKKHSDIFRYSTVWMDSITHVTKKGSSEFGLSNTNKLLKSYQGITGLKTGSTGLAKYCLSATARRNDMDMIAVIMAAPDTKTRFKEAASLLNYGFSMSSIYKHNTHELELPTIPLLGGIEEFASLRPATDFSYLCLKGENPETITYELVINESCEAPVTFGQVLGSVRYLYEGKEIGTVDLVAAREYEKASFGDMILKTLHLFFSQKEHSMTTEAGI